MRTKHQLWRVSNGWLLLPEEHDHGVTLSSADAMKCTIFKDLDEFAKYTPKRERKRSRKPLTKATEPQHTLD